MSSQNFPNASVLQQHQTRPVWRNFQNLFQGLTLLKILPDFECYRNIQDSLELSKYQDCFNKMGVTMVAVSEKLLGSNEFIKYTNWQGEVYMDINHEICREVDPSNKTFLERQKSRLHSRFSRKKSQMRSLFQIGGTYIVTSDFQVIYTHEPTSLTDSPSIGFILNLCRSYTTASKSMSNNFQPIFTHSSPELRSSLGRSDSFDSMSSDTTSSSLPGHPNYI